MNGEIFEFENMYPAMIEDAKADEDKGAERSFKFANELEKNSCRALQKST